MATQLEQTNTAVAEIIRQALPKGLGFVLVLYQPDGTFAYSTNLPREALLPTLHELASMQDRS